MGPRTIPKVGPTDLFGALHSTVVQLLTMTQLTNSGSFHNAQVFWNIAKIKHMLDHQVSHHKIKLTEILSVKNCKENNDTRNFQLLENEAPWI